MKITDPSVQLHTDSVASIKVAIPLETGRRYGRARKKQIPAMRHGKRGVTRAALWGVCADGTEGNGTVFSISLSAPLPQLTITAAAGNVILTWPTNVTGFTLDHESCCPNHCQRATHGHQSRFGHTAVFSVEPVKLGRPRGAWIRFALSRLFGHFAQHNVSACLATSAYVNPPILLPPCY